MYRVDHRKPTPQIMLFILHVYMFSCINNTAFQSLFLSTQNFIQKYYDIIEAPQNHFDTMGKKLVI